MVAIVVLAGCGGGGSDGPASTPTRTPTPLPIVTPTSIEDRCKVPHEGGELIELTAADGSVMSGAVEGDGERAAVFLHQTSPSGFCGWVAYAAWAADRGVSAVLLDLCGWGRSRCRPELAADPMAQVRLAVDEARQRGARSVTVVGASLGGATALAVGQQAGADAIVDLSGPFSYPGLASAEVAAIGVSVPLLVAMAPNDTQMQPTKLEAAVGTGPAQVKRFIKPGDGHGWGLLNDGTDAAPEWTPLATTVLRWVQGRYDG